MALELADHAEALTAINADQDAMVARDVGGLFAQHGGRSDLTRATHMILPQIIKVRGSQSGLLAANWYNGIDPGSKFKAKPYTDVPAEQIEKVIDWALHAPGEQPPQDRLVGSAQRLVRGVSRQTVVRNAAKEGVRYARHAKEDACAFCRALSLRGSGREDQKYLYDTAESAKFRKSDGEKYHTNCGCEPIPIRGGKIWVPPEYAAEWQNQYNDAAGQVEKGPKYFARVVEQMRQNEPKPEPEEAEDDGADVIEITRPDPAKVAARATLDEAADLQAVATAAKALLPDARVGINPKLIRMEAIGTWDAVEPAIVDNVKSMVQAADDMVTKYPELALESLQDASQYDFSGSGVYAHARSVPGGHAGHQVQVSRSWLANPARLDESWTAGVETGFHYEGTANPVYDIVIHEMGHVMQRTAEDRGVYINDNDISRALVTAFLASRDSKIMGSANLKAYDAWLADNLSGYSRHTSGSTVGGINGREALAEAFADVEINGEEAHDTSVVLHALLVDAYTRSLEGDAGGLAPAV